MSNLVGVASVYNTQSKSSIPMEIREKKNRWFTIFKGYVKNSEDKQICVGDIKLERIRNRDGDLKGDNQTFIYPGSSLRFYGWDEDMEPRSDLTDKIWVEDLKSFLSEKSHKENPYKGIGTALMQAAMEFAYLKKANGKIMLDASYRSHGFYILLGMKPFKDASKKENDKIENVIKEKLEEATKENKACDTSKLRSVDMYLPYDEMDHWEDRIEANPILLKTRDFIQRQLEEYSFSE